MSWSPRQWGAVVAVLLVLHVLGAGLLGLGNHEGGPPTVPPWKVRWLDAEQADAAVRRGLSVLDPTLFALPHELGFAGESWRMASDFPAPTLGWNDGPRWVAGRSNWLALPWPAAPVRAESVAAGIGRPTAAPIRLEIAPLPMPAGTVIELDPILAERGVELLPMPPVLVHSNLLAGTVVEVSVEPDGHVFSAIVLQGSGAAEADRLALGSARTARFRALAPPGLPTTSRQWGRMIFRWRAVGSAAAGAGGEPVQ